MGIAVCMGLQCEHVCRFAVAECIGHNNSCAVAVCIGSQ